jgi:acyl-CoA synthetase (AMP-forming)/AMP-acid ligase II
MHATDTLAEADRLMTVCNSCRYCEGLCAVFPAMEMRREFLDGDLNYLANLCHSCGACYTDCQFSPPHEFNVNVPKILSKARSDSYEAYAWPRFDENTASALCYTSGTTGRPKGVLYSHRSAVLHAMAANTGGQIGSVMAAAIMLSVLKGLGIL